ncbi:sensor histidine kinase [Halonatronum saccharophilum]|uniref:sensor histidine kinase n=1 Tax=Halonatronum saccharophilum TaxID=150060 RepID=UPI0004B5668B|nr:ATP-binding protein [Halonatronum saccharophilum]
MFKEEYIILIALIQSFLLIILSSWQKLGVMNNLSSVIINIILFISIGLSILAIIMVKDYSRIIKLKIDYKVQRVKDEENLKMIKSLRSQKHDFINHLQTIYGMIQLNKTKDVKDYIKSLSKDLVSVDKNNEYSNNSLLDSILLPKRDSALKSAIDFDYILDPNIHKINLSLNKIFRLLSNLVDNAIEATGNFSGEKKIEVRGIDKDQLYLLSVYNSGPTIDNKFIDAIFEPGFSTKGEERGYGLYIIKNLVEETGGHLEIVSKKGYGTEFRCLLRKKRLEKEKLI